MWLALRAERAVFGGAARRWADRSGAYRERPARSTVVGKTLALGFIVCCWSHRPCAQARIATVVCARVWLLGASDLEFDPSCAHAAAAGITDSGVVAIQDPISGVAHLAYCDMETDGGGWMLLLSYNHVGGQNNPLNPGTLPISPTAGYAFPKQEGSYPPFSVKT